MNDILKKSLTESKFNMWRACISVVFLDGKVTREEEKWVKTKLNQIPFSNEQKKILLSDFQKGMDIRTIIPDVTDKKDRAFLLHMIRVISNLDHDYDPKEKKAFQELESSIMKNIDIASLEKQVNIIEKESYHEDNVYKVHNKNSLFENMTKSFIKFINIDDYSEPGDLL